MRVIDYTRVEFSDSRSVEPRSRRGFFGVGYDDAGTPVAGETVADRDHPGEHRFAGPLISAEAMARFSTSSWASGRANFLQIDDSSRLRGDKVTAALGQLRKPVPLLVVGDAVVRRSIDEDRIWRHDSTVLAREDERLCVDGDWYGSDGQPLDGDVERSIASATTMSGQQPCDSVHGDINAQLYLLRDHVEQWNPHNPELTEQISSWCQRLDLLDGEIERIEVEHSIGPTRLMNLVSDLNLMRGRLETDMERLGIGASRATPSAEHTARIAGIHSRSAELDQSGDDGPQPGA